MCEYLSLSLTCCNHIFRIIRVGRAEINVMGAILHGNGDQRVPNVLLHSSRRPRVLTQRVVTKTHVKLESACLPTTWLFRRTCSPLDQITRENPPGRPARSSSKPMVCASHLPSRRGLASKREKQCSVCHSSVHSRFQNMSVTLFEPKGCITSVHAWKGRRNLE